jgi:hypothetical protein
LSVAVAGNAQHGNTDTVASLQKAGAPAWVTDESGCRVMWVSSKSVGAFLDARHYLGPCARGFAWSDDFGVLVLAKPTSRRLPQDGTWLELVRWCLVGTKNGGSQQWRRVVRAIRVDVPQATTVVSYSDPSAGHTGALYKACNWLWKPTWHRLRPPPSGNGSWRDGKAQAVKDRWIYPLQHDARRDSLLAIQDEALARIHAA